MIKFSNLKLAWAKHQKRWFGKWHLYLGIIAGFIVSIVGLTGSILVFQDEIDHALNPAFFKVLEQQHKMPLEEILPVIRKNYPDLKPMYIGLTDQTANSTYRLYDPKQEKEIFINPYTAKICGKRMVGSSFIGLVTNIHRTLLIPAIGRYIVGLSALCLLILTISGLRLWIPKKWKQLKEVLTVNFKASFKRQNYDWHNVLGFYTSPIVVLLSLTGFCITFSIIVIPLLFLLNGQSPQGVAKLLGAKSAYAKGIQPMPLPQITELAKKQVPGARLEFISLPADSTGSYRMDFIGPYVAKSGKRQMIISDQYNGKILLNSNTDFPNTGQAYLSWLTPIHYGSFGGMPTKILAIIGGLTPLALFITGFIIWWPRYKKQKRKRRRKLGQPEKITKPVIVESPVTRTGAWKYIALHYKKGISYALWTILFAFLMGGLYGLVSGIVLEPAVFSLIFTGILVTANFLVAFIVMLFNLIFLTPFKKGRRPVLKYFSLSLAFVSVFIPAVMLITLSGVRIF